MEDNSIGSEILVKSQNFNINVKRVIAFFIDLITFAVFPIIINVLEDIIGKKIISSDVLFYATTFFYLFKDLFNSSGSFGKKTMNLTIINSSNQGISFSLKKVLRNITNFIWPIEGIFILLTKQRLSDRLLNIDVINNNQ
ncbi:RDD family protein [Spongiivirga citrea]|uniref:RDD domain-containing protein n=1 Tax=Spongiivirga citrea TaxID=1481457 RepID=A0A6M0CG14_9FLAO|nr:RDD family protein [Spongiivirga citrea]NER16775.1 hypothetical protein [Spongiivirga citrea]